MALVEAAYHHSCLSGQVIADLTLGRLPVAIGIDGWGQIPSPWAMARSRPALCPLVLVALAACNGGGGNVTGSLLTMTTLPPPSSDSDDPSATGAGTTTTPTGDDTVGEGTVGEPTGDATTEPAATSGGPVSAGSSTGDDPPPGCGDGVVAGAEQCDDGNGDNTDDCLNNCVAAGCGDGFVWVGVESCDDAGESPQCNADCSPSACGDGVVNEADGEACDANGQTAQCDGDCTPVTCGDGTLNGAAGEDCDDGNKAGGDGCSAQCLTEGIQICETGNDPKSGKEYVICAADDFTIWISHSAPAAGDYHAQKICKDLGYPELLQWGGTCGFSCSGCDFGTCQLPGSMKFDGAGDCGEDELGPILCGTVMWFCAK